jgi:hypothetical protein
MEFFHEPCRFAAISVKGDGDRKQPNAARVLEGPVPDWKHFGSPETGNGKPGDAGIFAFFVDSNDVTVDHCWFRGGWWDALTLSWRNVQKGILPDNPPIENGKLN